MRAPDEERMMRDTWEPEVLEKLIERHKKVKARQKAKKHKKGYATLVLVDDFADTGDRAMCSITNVLMSLFVRGVTWGVHVCWLRRTTGRRL